MIQRILYEVAFSGQWGRQMRFVSGPRQAGKTTLAREKLAGENSGALYYLWDLRRVRQRYKDNELFFTADALPQASLPWVCFDEIHKMPKWKNILKAIYDETHDRYRFIITGSAKLDMMKRSGDSLAGRYFTFHLMPLILKEVLGRVHSDITDSAENFIQSKLQSTVEPQYQKAVEDLLEYGGFPEPFLQQSRVFHVKWRNDYLDTVIREDIGTLTRIVDREYIFDLYHLLPGMVGSPVSVSSLAAHLQISPVTAKNYLRRLEDFYLVFSIRPYVKNIKRSLLKAAKYYLYEGTSIADEGVRFENYVACELKTRLHIWSDVSGEDFRMFYIRNKQKEETDFLVVRAGQPWLLVEAKLRDGPVDRHHFETASALGNIPLVQICRQPGVASMQKNNVFRISASCFFA